MKAILLLLIGAFSLATVSPTFAITSVATTSTTSATTIAQQNANLKNEFKMQKKASKFQRLLQKAGIDFKDPVEKWLWIGLLLWLIGAVMWALPNVWYLAGLVTLAGTICIIVWLVKKFTS